MSAEKAEVKMATAHAIGVQHDDRLEAAKAEVHRFEGASGAMKQAGENLNNLIAQFQKEVDEGKLDEHGDSVLKVASLVTQWLRRAVGTTVALGDIATDNKLKCMGKVEALEQAVADVMRVFKDERAKADALKAGKTELPMRRIPGAHPGKGTAAARKAEPKAKSGGGSGSNA